MTLNSKSTFKYFKNLLFIKYYYYSYKMTYEAWAIVEKT